MSEKLSTCNDRVSSRSSTEETCTEELFDYLHCVDHCVSKSYLCHRIFCKELIENMQVVLIFFEFSLHDVKLQHYTIFLCVCWQAFLYLEISHIAWNAHNFKIISKFYPYFFSTCSRVVNDRLCRIIWTLDSGYVV